METFLVLPEGFQQLKTNVYPDVNVIHIFNTYGI